MAKRRGNQEGSVYQRADGRWCASVSLGHRPDGKRKRKVIYGTTKREVLEKLRELQRKTAAGVTEDPGKMTLGEFIENWLENVSRPQVRASTYGNYKSVISNHIVPGIGQLRLTKVAAIHIQSHLSELERSGVGGRVRQLVYVILKMAMRQAVRWGMIERNPLDHIDRPRHRAPEMQVWDEHETATFLASIKGDRLEALFVVALTCGLRLTELLGLKWKDVDLKRRHLQVRRKLVFHGGQFHEEEPKTRGSRRLIVLPKRAVTVLRQYRKQSLAAGHAAAPYLFVTEDGAPLKGDVLRRRYRAILKGLDLPSIRLHDLRHTAASLMLLQGIHAKVVSERLGHASIAITLDTYSHLLPSMQEEAAAKLDELFGG